MAGFFQISKDTPGCVKRRELDLGAHINEQDNLEILRTSDAVDGYPSYLNAENNKGLVIRQADTDNNPEGLELIQEGSGNALVVRNEYSANDVCFISSAGRLSAADVVDRSSEELKENFQNMGDKVIRKIMNNIVVRRYNMKAIPGVVRFGATAENFREVTGFGDGSTISPGSAAFLAIRMAQDLSKRLEAIEPAESE